MLRINNQFSNIVESGSNSNGKYVKFSDGTLIQQGIATQSANADAYDLTFPTAFVDKTYSINVIWWYQWFRATTTTYSAQTTSSIRIFGMFLDGTTWIQTTEKEPTFQWIAIGRWKA